jgi:phage gp36-like protein
MLTIRNFDGASTDYAVVQRVSDGYYLTVAGAFQAVKDDSCHIVTGTAFEGGFEATVNPAVTEPAELDVYIFDAADRRQASGKAYLDAMGNEVIREVFFGIEEDAAEALSRYIDRTDLNMPDTMLAQLTDDEGYGLINTGRLNEAIADAQAEVDGYCGKRYRVPFSVPPRLVKRLTAILAKYNLYARRDIVPDSLETQRKAAIKALDDISKGVVSLGVETEPTPSPETGGVISGPVKMFGRESLRGF